jgi:hypothetical protein
LKIVERCELRAAREDAPAASTSDRIAVNTLGVSRRVFIVFAGTPCEEKATDRVVAVRRLG